VDVLCADRVGEEALETRAVHVIARDSYADVGGAQVEIAQEAAPRRAGHQPQNRLSDGIDRRPKPEIAEAADRKGPQQEPRVDLGELRSPFEDGYPVARLLQSE
jgi:hypothetical protein